MADQKFDPSKVDPKKVPLPVLEKNPARCSITGDIHLKPEIKQIINETDIPATLKQFLINEVDKLKSNGAEIHLHLLDHSNGDVSLQLHVKAVQLGRRQVEPRVSG